jgi:cellulose synthase/poly-beta-1,6-N-acetylglucosamine synthase-like glycosyltransferase
MDWAWIIPIPVFAAYTILMLTYLYGWIKTIRPADNKWNSKDGKASIVIPVRNEEEGIGALLEDLQKQNLPKNHYEIIIVNDHSTDHTAGVVQSYASNQANIRLIELEEGEYGKKTAIRKGILQAQHEVIISTDGDCRVPPGWLGHMMAAFREPGIRMVAGPVIIDPDNGWFRSMQSLEFLSLIGVSTGSAGLGSPIMCNAASLAYLKEDFLQYLETGEPGSASGDDMFLMLWLKEMHPGSVRYITYPGAAIRTRPASNLQEFIMQRLRWASKSRLYLDFHLTGTALLVFLTNACLMMLAAVSCFVSARWITLFALLLTVKCLVDLIFMNEVLGYFGKRKLLLVFLPLELIYFMYVSIVGVASQVTPYTWKGRNIHP